MAPTKTETELRVDPTDKWYERCLKLMARVDWRGLAFVLAALAGIGGAIWNKLDSIVERTLAARTLQGVYEVLADKLDDVSARLASLETAHGIQPKPPAAPDQPSPGSETGRVAPMFEPDAAMAAIVVNADSVPDTVAPPAGAAQLPSFQTIQKHAQNDELPRLLRRDAPMAAAPATN